MQEEIKARRILRWPEVKHTVRRSRSQVWRDERVGKFPRRVQLGPNSVGWFSDEIADHLERLTRSPVSKATVE